MMRRVYKQACTSINIVQRVSSLRALRKWPEAGRRWRAGKQACKGVGNEPSLHPCNGREVWRKVDLQQFCAACPLALLQEHVQPIHSAAPRPVTDLPQLMLSYCMVTQMLNAT